MAVDEHKICFIMCTNDDMYLKECLLYISQLEVPKGYEVSHIAIKGAKSMTEGYNRAMSESDAKYKVYLHQDVMITNRHFIPNLLEIFKSDEKIGMVGMIGNRHLPDDGCPWSGETDYRIGSLYIDFIRNSQVVNASNFPSAIKPYEDVIVIDGLLMATQYDIPWRDDLFKGWDFYDCSQSMEFIKAGYRVVVPYMEEPWVLHDNDIVNMTNYDRWRRVFVEEYKDTYSNDYKSKSSGKVTVIILPGTDPDLNKRCSDSIRRYSAADNVEIITAVNTGGDNYAKMINDAVRNLDIQEDFIIFDSRLFAQEDFIAALLRCAEANSNVGTVSPVFSCDIYDVLVNVSYRGHNSGNYEALATQPYAVYIKHELWEKLGGFNEALLSPYYTMVDFQLRVLKGGYRNIISTAAKANSDSRMAARDLNAEIYSHDMKVMESIWGMHYINVLPNNNLVNIPPQNINYSSEMKVLEVGCDCGATLMAIGNVFPNVSLYGVELNENAANIAKAFAQVKQGNIETDGIPFEGVKFDIIIFGDVLEHLRSPEDTVKMCREHLSDGGRIICSIPNVQHISVLRQLIYGRFTYTETGLLDKTHIHFFTAYEIQKMFSNAEYTVEDIRCIQFPITAEEQEMIDKFKSVLPGIDEQQMKAFQYVVWARNKESESN